MVAYRWQCDLCFESHGQYDTPWRLRDEFCNHSFCHRCILGSIRWGGRCPYDNTPIPQIVICGAMGTGEYVYHEKLAESRRTSGIMCSVADCPGVVPAAEGKPSRSMACKQCGARHCGRKVCGAPWSDGHRCWDIVEEERRCSEQGWWSNSSDAHVEKTVRRLALTPRFRPCPDCGVMVEHVGGCNMVYHESCRARWCFVCRRLGTCSDFDCRSPESGPPTPKMSFATTVFEEPAVTKAAVFIKTLFALGMLLLSLAVFAFVGTAQESGFVFMGSLAMTESIRGQSSVCQSCPRSTPAVESL